MKVFRKNKFSGFTLIELLVVIAILAVLAVAVVLVLKPAELIKQSRDSNRLSDLDTINRGVAVFRVERPTDFIGNAYTIYISLPDNGVDNDPPGANIVDDCDELGLPSLPTGWRYKCVTQDNLRKTNGNGWIPINFSSLSGVPVPGLPIDPAASASNGLYFTYVTDPANGSWKFTGLFESEKIVKVMNNDGGPDATLFEVGTGLNLANFAKGLTGYWKFDEGSGGTTNDLAIGIVNNGVLRPSTLQGPIWVSGKINNALQFDGSDDYVEINTARYLSDFITNSAGTMMAWVKMSGTAPGDIVYNLPAIVGDSSAWAVLTRGIFSNNDFIWAYNYDNNDDPIGVGYSVGQWMHLAWVHGGGNLYIYKDGVLGGTVLSGNTGQLTGNLIIGGGNSPHYSNGIIDDVRIYNRALSVQEIKTIYNATK